MIRMLDHTADVGFELEAPTLEALFDEARQALLMTLFEEPPKGGGGRTLRAVVRPRPWDPPGALDQRACLLRARGEPS
jgi:hypothetical protein